MSEQHQAEQIQPSIANLNDQPPEEAQNKEERAPANLSPTQAKQNTIQQGQNESIQKQKSNENIKQVVPIQSNDIEMQSQKINNKEIAKRIDEDQSKEKGKSEPLKQVKFSELFRFATGSDKCLLALGAFAAFANGASLPLFSLIFGEMIDSFGAEYTPQKVVDNALVQAMWFLIIGASSAVLSWLQMACWMGPGEHQAIKCRKAYFKAILKQDISWFDKVNPNQLATKVATETFAIQGAIGEKVPTFIMTMSTLFCGFAVAFIRGWELSLICCAALPFLSVATGFFTYYIQQSDSATAASYLSAGAKSEQAFQGIKTVKALSGQEHEQNFYKKTLREAYNIAVRFGQYVAISVGVLWFIMLADYGLGFWFGSIFVGDQTNNAIYDRPYTGGDVIVIFFAIMMGGFSVGQAAPCIENFQKGQQAAYKVFAVLDAKPTISPSLLSGKKLSKIEGNIQLKDVEFTYPQKPDVQVLRKLNLTFQAGKKTALVGESGCGKSTIIQLIERFYDCDKGQVLVEGENMKDLDLKHLRDNIGYVGQEPVLFATTIRENLKFGQPDATEEEMIKALKQAQAYEFVQNLEDKLDTFVGTSGSQLSGGQKQRLCIARAILKNPPILLLDEATSALDRKNEKSIQETLDQISLNRTTIVIAHRLSTIQNADCIFVIDLGLVAEQGTHETLFKQGGKYTALCQNQIQNEAEENENGEELPGGRQSIKNVSLKKGASMVAGSQAQQVQQGQEEEEEKVLTKEEKAALAKEEEILKKSLLNKLYKLNSPEKPWMFMGGIFSFVVGTSFPLCSVCMSYMMDILGKVSIMDKDEFREESNKWCFWFLIISIGAGVGTYIQFASWKKVSEGLTMRLRTHSFWKILNMPVGWFDTPENNPGTLAARLGSDTQIVNGLTSTVVNIQISNMSAFLTGMTIGFIFDWRTTLVAFFCFPILFIAGALQAEFMQGFSEATDGGYKDSGSLVSESVVNMRTVLSFSNEKEVLSVYTDKLKKPLSLVNGKANKAGILFGFSQLSMFLVYAILFYVGALFHRDQDVPVVNMFTAIFAIMYAAFGAGNNNMFMTDIGAGYNAAKNLFKILESDDENDIHKKFKPDGELIKTGVNITGNIEFENVCFTYPQRDKQVLNNLSFKINSGEKVAFVGSSGCGKSTIMQLVMRFYEIDSGNIYIEGKNIKEYDVNYLRSYFGVVSQEPVLFQGTIEENIRYNSENAELDAIKQAAQKANAAGFIENDEFEIEEVEEEEEQNKEQQKEKQQIGTGYQRKVGNKGNQLSGGQKQRIAIARAILKDPKILLLDEATSALDTKNEAIVQDSLNRIMENKTTLCIAHRISTIKDSDNIMVIDEGKLVEQGKYQDLVNKKDYFYRLERGDQNK